MNFVTSKRWGALFTIDARSLAVFRVALSALIVFDLLHRAQNLGAHYSDYGILTRDELRDLFPSRVGQAAPYLLDGSAVWAATLFFATGISALALGLGYRTRFSCVLCWLGVLALQGRNPMLLQGGDALLRLLLFWGCLLPLGARWSWDERRENPAPNQEKTIVSWASAGVLIQVACVYLFSALLKTGAAWHGEANAVEIALRLDYLAYPLANWLLNWPKLLPPFTHTIWLLEFVGPLLAFVPFHNWQWRLVLIGAFWVMHIGMALCLQLGFFSPLCMAAWLLFLPSQFWDFRRAKKAQIEFLPREKWGLQVLAGYALAFVLVINLSGTLWKNWVDWVPDFARVPGQKLVLTQEWNLFAPAPTSSDGWMLLVGVSPNGARVNLADGNALNWRKPRFDSAWDANFRWRKYLRSLRTKKRIKRRAAFARWACVKSRHEGKLLQSVQIFYVRESAKDEAEAQRLGEWACGTMR